MKKGFISGLIVMLLASCLHERYSGEDCRARLLFGMEDVPYLYENDGTVGYRPYYVFTEQLDVFLFDQERLAGSENFDYHYCRTHPVIPLETGINTRYYLFAANLYDPKELDWKLENGKLEAWFKIVDNEEPPVLLAATGRIVPVKDSVHVALRMMVSRLEIRLTNPPRWVNGLDVTVRDIAATVGTDFSLKDTTHINKKIWFDNQGPGTYNFGVNTFPSFEQKRAILTLDLLGSTATSPILVDDSRLHLLPGAITLLNIAFDSEDKITVSIEINGKWEIVDEGNIII